MGRVAAAAAAFAFALMVSACTSDGQSLPELVGLQVGEAIEVLERRELEFVVRDDEDADAPPGEVVATQPGGGESVDGDTVVVLSVAVEPLDLGDDHDPVGDAAGQPPPDPEPELEDTEVQVSEDDFEILTVGFGRTGIGSANAGALVRYTGPEPLYLVDFQYTLRDEGGRAVATTTEAVTYLFPGDTDVVNALVLYDQQDRPVTLEVEVLGFVDVIEADQRPGLEVTGLELRGERIVGELVNHTGEQLRVWVACAALSGGQLVSASDTPIENAPPDRTVSVDVLVSETDSADEVVCSVFDRDLF